MHTKSQLGWLTSAALRDFNINQRYDERNHIFDILFCEPLSCHLTRSLLYFSVGKPNWTRQSLYKRCFREITNLIALFWIFQCLSITPFLCGDHTEFAHSRCGLTKDLYSRINVFLSIYMKLRLIKPNMLYALLIFN